MSSLAKCLNFVEQVRTALPPALWFNLKPWGYL